MKALRKAEKRKIGDLWLASFNTLVQLKPGLLVRRHGPLLIGIAIEPGNTDRVYHPVFHVHNLATADSGLSLALEGRLVGRFGLPEEVPRNVKDMEERKVIERFQSQYPLVATPRMSFNDYVRVTRSYLDGKHGFLVGKEIWPYHNILVTAAWCGYQEYVLRNLNRILQLTKDWPEQCLQFVGGRGVWRDKVVSLSGQPEIVNQTVNAEVVRHGLQDVTDFTLVVDDSPNDLVV